MSVGNAADARHGVSEPDQPGRPSRAPWFVAAGAVIVALAAVVTMLATRGGSSSDSSERGFDDPEAAITYVADRLAAGDAEGASSAFVVERAVDGYDFEAQADWIKVVAPDTWLPADSAAARSIDAGVRRGAVAVELRILVRSVLAPDRDPLAPVLLDGSVTPADVAAELDLGRLDQLSVQRVDELDRGEASWAAQVEAQRKIYGAEAVKQLAVLYDTPNGPAMGGATLLEYDGEWFVWSLASALLDVSPGRVTPTSEQDYLDAIDQARG
jgi:hypothetical protein